MKVSIIIPVRYNPSLTRVCLDSIIGYTKDYELILVQEGEDKEITELLKAYPAKFIQNKEPKGYAGALNAGMKMATGDVFCFMNNDTVVTPGWMEEMLKAFEGRENRSVGLVSPTFWGTGDRQSVDWNRNGIVFDRILEPLCLMGVCFLISRECMEVLDDPKWPGQWDEDFIHGGEDFDITLRVEGANYTMVIARKSFIYHYGGASTRIYLGNDFTKVQQYHLERVLQLIKKHNLNAEDTFQRLQHK